MTLNLAGNCMGLYGQEAILACSKNLQSLSLWCQNDDLEWPRCRHDDQFYMG